MGLHRDTDGMALIGPNAVLQMASALRELYGDGVCRRIFALAGLSRHLNHPPHAMIPESDAMALFAAVRAALDGAESERVFCDAGLKTADYILKHRIPASAQSVLAALPCFLAARLLLAAIAKHSWTFCGSAEVTCRYGRTMTLALNPNTLAVAGCTWHRAVFERLFEVILRRPVSVRAGMSAHAPHHAIFSIAIRRAQAAGVLASDDLTAGSPRISTGSSNASRI